MKKTVTLFLFLILCLTTLLAQKYNRIVSLAPSLTESLYYLEAEDRLVGRTSYCTIADNDDIPVVASAIKVNIEKVISTKPDVVLALGLTDPKDIEALRKVGITVEVLKSPQSFEDICNQFIQLGEAIDKTEAAVKIVSESKQKVAQIQEYYKNKKTSKIFFQIGSDPLFTVLPNTYMNDFITFVGGENISKELSKGIIGREFVVAKNPDYIFICTMGEDNHQETELWRKYKSINAVKNDRLFTVEAKLACQPTPVTFIKTLEVMHKVMKNND